MTSGGKRIGAGRPTIPEQDKRVIKSFSLSADSDRKIKELRRQGVNVGKEIDRMVSELYEKKK